MMEEKLEYFGNIRESVRRTYIYLDSEKKKDAKPPYVSIGTKYGRDNHLD
jgi:hypothetical protein